MAIADLADLPQPAAGREIAPAQSDSKDWHIFQKSKRFLETAAVVTARRNAVTRGIAARLTDRLKIHESALSPLRTSAV
ncbi:hypothetical protein HUU39_26885 [candidate division KSB1 bacterium]|nr:hypothetical protein [bacterium]NUM68850.1 hypothetical protein [candidate division KSB1 bacterium]